MGKTSVAAAVFVRSEVGLRWFEEKPVASELVPGRALAVVVDLPRWPLDGSGGLLVDK